MSLRHNYDLICNILYQIIWIKKLKSVILYQDTGIVIVDFWRSLITNVCYLLRLPVKGTHIHK